MRLLLAAAVAAALLAVASPAPAAKPGPFKLAERGLARAVEAGRLTPTEAGRYRTVLARARAVRKLPPLRLQTLEAVVADVAAQWQAYTRPRALALFATLEANLDYLASHRLPASGTDVNGADGVVYRFFPGHGLVFHPLANFARLNARVSAGDADAAAALAAALLERGVPARSGGLVWEYEFPFGSGKPPWTSGMAQAVAAQALARAGDLLGDPALLDAADEAFTTIAGLTRALPSGPWVALYSFDRTPVLNAQLQAAISLDDYAGISGNPGAAALAARATTAARALLGRFDTGYWSLYSLRGDEATPNYHDFVISLLLVLARRTGDTVWRETADRFRSYETQPPEIRPGAVTPTVYPEPADGYLDEARVRFWLSKRSAVTLEVGDFRHTVTLGHGMNTLTWAPGDAPPGLYHPRLTAVGPVGHRAEAELSPVLVRHDTSPPRVTVTVTAPATLSWQAEDEGTPWLRLQVRLDRGTEHRMLDLGRRALSGTARLKLPPGRWHAALVAANSAGKARYLSLGFLPR